jgi:hypothetical protein
MLTVLLVAALVYLRALRTQDNNLNERQVLLIEKRKTKKAENQKKNFPLSLPTRTLLSLIFILTFQFCQ